LKAIFKKVTAEDILNLRHKVLRAGKPKSTANFDGDKSDSTYHFACILNSDPIGCLSLMKKSHEDFSVTNQYQLRGMAVDDNFRGKNVGKHLLEFAEKELISHQNLFIWCNVRVSAINFYSKNGYLRKGHTFNIPNVGSHVLMYKKLIQNA
jgi:ribosomal protein S18 acetylase RimI-like enzyme